MCFAVFFFVFVVLIATVGGKRVPAPYKAKHGDKDVAADETATATTTVNNALQGTSDASQLLEVSEPTPILTVKDAVECPKANASTYNPPQPRHEKHAQQAVNSRPKAMINQPGANRHA